MTLLAGIAGCVTGPWSQVGGLFNSTPLNFSVDLPQGWMKSNASKDLLLITRDGMLLQRIGVSRLDINKELQNTKKICFPRRQRR